MRKLIEFVSIIALLFVIGAGGYSFFNLGIFNDIDATIQVFDGLGWFISLFAIATVFTSYLVVIADTKFIFRFLAIPAWLAFSFALLTALDQFIGYPYPGVPPTSQVLQYRVIVNEDQSKTIEAWMYLPTEYKTRVFSFPHSLNREEALYKTMRAKARGEYITIDIEELIITYDIPHQGLPLKEDGPLTVQTGNPQEIDRSNKITLQLPDGTIVEIQPGKSFTITNEGEIEMFNDKRIPGFYDEEDIEYNTYNEPGRGRHPGGNNYGRDTIGFVPDYDEHN